MKRLTWFVACGALLAGLGGCSSSTRLDEHSWCAEVAEVQCRWIYSCCNLGERLALLGLNAHEESESTCREQVTAGCLDNWSVPTASISIGRMRFETESAAACLTAMRDSAGQCPAVQEEPAECKKVVAGLVGMDGECAYDDECAGQARCRHLGAGASGRCYDKAGVDGLCEATLDCQDGLFCYHGTTPQYVCVALDTVGAGETCSAAGPYCGDGYYCDADTDKCVAQQASGAQCGSTAECQAGLICDGTGRCGAGLGSGQPCTYYDSDCAVGLYCDQTTDQCTPRKGNGASCYAAGECDASLYCDQSGRCSARHPSGEGCSSGADSCVVGFACQPRGNCAARGDVGSECYSADHCLERLRCNPDSRVCEMKPTKLGEGEFCLTNAECQSGKCDSGVCIAFCSGEP